MDDRFYNAFLPPSVTICGREIRAFTLWHHLILCAIDSPIANGADSLVVRDIQIASKVCSLKYGNTNINPSIKDLIYGLFLKRSQKRFEIEAKSFCLWMEKQSSPPKYFIASSGGVNKGINSGPRCLSLACCLMSRGGLSRADAWNTPLGEALWMEAQLAQMEGAALRFLDDADLDDSQIDLSKLTDDEAMRKFQDELPEDLIGATFDHWKQNIKGKGLNHD